MQFNKDFNHKPYGDKETCKIQWEDKMVLHSLSDSRNNNQVTGERAMTANMAKQKKAKNADMRKACIS